ncbi:hypothetical protein LFZ31_00300 [Salmonella enterica subsp. enterica serovar Newport str. S09097]|nr:hypothetical protein LFZ31_00300 [Salmonella enterica subsp. enterica serovar Newport str. S09097]
MLAVWVLLLTMNAVDYTNFSFLPELLETAVVVAVCGIVFWRGCWTTWRYEKHACCKTLFAVVITTRNYNG